MKMKPLAIAALLFVACCDLAVAECNDKPRILVTNDDGYATAGIAALATELSTFAEVVVVAPLKNQSGASQATHSLSIKSGIRVIDVKIGEQLDGYAVSGSPTDAVYIGTDLFGKEQPFDMVVSGINHGPNYGISYFYSGTIGAAFQASSQGIPAIAISQSLGRDEFETAAKFAAKLARHLLQHPLPEGIVVSVNVPNGEIKGAVAAPPGESPETIGLVPFEAEDGETRYRAEYLMDEDVSTTHDVKAYKSGYIAVTPLRVDRSQHESIWELAATDFIGLPEE
jgi:5'-nucleotidase